MKRVVLSEDKITFFIREAGIKPVFSVTGFESFRRIKSEIKIDRRK